MRRHKKKRGRASKRREKKKKKTANTPATTTTTGFRLVLEDGSCFEEKRWERFEERERERSENSRSRFSNGNVFKRESGIRRRRRLKRSDTRGARERKKKMEAYDAVGENNFNPSSSYGGNARQNATWSPYDNNGGTVMAVAGEDYVICAADTRMSTGYSIMTRHYTKVDEMSPKTLMASAGFMADAATLKKLLKGRCEQYKYANNKPIGCVAFAQMLSNTLYMRRFFPYYAFNIVAGLDAEGKGAVFTYDAVGSYERTNYSCQGSGQQLIMPVLDNQLKTVSPLVLPAVSSATPLSEQDSIDLIKDCFATATERDIYTGDAVELFVMNKDGIRKETMPLKKD